MRFLKISSFAFLLVGLLAFVGASIELETKALLGNKIELKIPKGFAIMSEEMAKAKYPTDRRPTLIYTNESGTINVALNLNNSRASQAEMPAIKETIMHTFRHRYMSAKYKFDDLKVINGRKVGLIEMHTPATDTNIYNLIFFTDVQGRLLLCTVNCTENNIEQWQPAAKEIMASLKVK